jgi:RNA polymerase sigma-70 factor (ECF subfamily)
MASVNDVPIDLDDRSAADDPRSAGARRLAERAAAGDHDAWEQIFRSAYPRLWAYASHHVGRNTADDVVSETMTRAVNGISAFRWNASGIDPWLFGIARRVVADHHRRAGRLRRWSRAVAAPAVALPSDVAELAYEHASVRAAFNRLSADDREILGLRVVAGLSPEQTATLLGKRPGAIRTAQSRALARLRKRLGQEVGPQ